MHLKMLIILLAFLYGTFFGPSDVQESSGPMQPEEVVEVDLGEGMSAGELHP